MVKKIKNLMLYVIYENNMASVSLEKELALLEEYIELEKNGDVGESARYRKNYRAYGRRADCAIYYPSLD